MPAIAAITIHDSVGAGQVAHAFQPNTVIGNQATYADRSGGLSIGYKTISITASQPSKTSRLYKTRIRLVCPVLEVANGTTVNGIFPAPTKAYDMTATIEFFCPERSTLRQREDLKALLYELVGSTAIASVVETQETIY